MGFLTKEESRRRTIEKIRRLVDEALSEGACVLWPGSLDKDGYGRCPNGWTGAHRVSYEAFNGFVPNGLDVHHTCNTKACINPAHLVVMTRAEHNRLHPLATKTHCSRGHEFTPENTYRTHKGRRICRTCAQRKNREGYLRRRAAKAMEGREAQDGTSEPTPR